jgi:hypothetical protein
LATSAKPTTGISTKPHRDTSTHRTKPHAASSSRSTSSSNSSSQDPNGRQRGAAAAALLLLLLLLPSPLDFRCCCCCWRARINKLPLLLYVPLLLLVLPLLLLALHCVAAIAAATLVYQGLLDTASSRLLNSLCVCGGGGGGRHKRTQL